MDFLIGLKFVIGQVIMICMALERIFFLGAVQGLTEFLPISSSGHLVLAQNLLGLNVPPLALDTFLHLGTLLAVAVFLRRELKDLFWGVFQKEGRAARRGVFLLIIASLPAAWTGLLWEKQISQLFSSRLGVGLGLLVTSFLLFSTRWVKKTSEGKDALERSREGMASLSWEKAFMVGLFQAASIAPGISRSGATIAAGLWLGLTPHQAFTFSFLLSMPAILGANLLQIKDLRILPNLWMVAGGMIVAFVGGFLALKFLQKVLLSEKLYYFAAYTLFLGILALILHLLF